jgi:RND superfamily putative drug exporter
MAVVGGIGIVFGLSHVTDVAMYTINVCSLIGLGVSIDYSFLVSRYREELAHGHPKKSLSCEQGKRPAGWCCSPA